MTASAATWEHIADLDELASGERKSVFIDDLPALLVRIEGQYFAVEDVCTHDGQPLTDGALLDHSIVCPRHGARFDLVSGKPLCMPATSPIRTFAVELRDDGIYASAAAAVPPTTEASSIQSAIPSTPPATEPPTVSGLAGSSVPEVAASGDNTNGEFASGDAANGDSVDDVAIIDALRQVIDPELMVNIVDLGLIYTVNHSDRKALVEMTLTSPACPAGPQIVQQAKMVVERLDGIDEAQIKLTMSPPWTPDRMTDEARDQLGFF